MPLLVWLGLAPAAHAMPRALIVSGPAATTTETTATFTFKPSSNGGLFGHFECELDGAGWAPCTSPHRVERLTAGSHGFAVRLVGLFTDTTPAIARWAVEAVTVITPAPIVPGGPLPKPGGRDYAGCTDAAASRTQVSARAMAGATLCLLNHERTTRGLKPLKSNARLAAAARRHAADMVNRRFFDHVSPGGGTVSRRVAQTGYLRGARHWTIGEVLAWTPSEYSTPRIAVRALMRSRPHRRLILEPTFREAGVAVVKRAPVGGQRAGATFVANFGRVATTER